MNHGLTPRTIPPAAVVAAPRRLRLVAMANAVVAALHLSALLLGDAAGTSQVLVALGCYGFSAGLVVWARRTARRHPAAIAVSPVAPARLIVHGPFRIVRQPIYTAYVCAWVAGSIATGNPWLLLSAVWMMVFYIAIAQREEERVERSVFADAYHTYRRTTGMLVPRLQIEFGHSPRPLSWEAW